MALFISWWRIRPTTRPRPWSCGRPAAAARTGWPGWRPFSRGRTSGCCGPCLPCRACGWRRPCVPRTSPGSTTRPMPTCASSGPGCGRQERSRPHRSRTGSEGGRVSEPPRRGAWPKPPWRCSTSVGMLPLPSSARPFSVFRPVCNDAWSADWSRPWVAETIRRGGTGWSAPWSASVANQTGENPAAPATLHCQVVDL